MNNLHQYHSKSFPPVCSLSSAIARIRRIIQSEHASVQASGSRPRDRNSIRQHISFTCSFNNRLLNGQSDMTTWRGNPDRCLTWHLTDMPCNNFVTALVRAQNMQGAGISFELNRDSTRTRMSSDRRLTLGAPYKQLTLENWPDIEESIDLSYTWQQRTFLFQTELVYFSGTEVNMV